MKKTLLLAGVACLFSFGANAADYSLSELRPYVGLDYVYTDANIKKETRIKIDNTQTGLCPGFLHLFPIKRNKRPERREAIKYHIK